MDRTTLAPWLLLASLAVAACRTGEPGLADSGIEAPPCDGGCAKYERCDLDTHACVLEVPSRCTAGTSWAPGARAFIEASVDWGLTPGVAEGTRLSVTDLEGDGWADLVVRRAGNVRDNPDAGTRAVWLLRNASGRSFEEVTAASGLLANRTDTAPQGRPAELILWADVDNDGDLDVFTGASGSTVESWEVLLNSGAGTFSLGPADSALRRVDSAIGGASFVDVNRDGFIDLWTGGASMGGSGTQDRLFIGSGDGRFVDVTAEAGLTTAGWQSISDLNQARAHSNAWGTAACDLNGDGAAELLTASYGRAPNHLWQASGARGLTPFANRSIASGYAFDERTDWTDNESARCWCKLHPADTDCAGVPAPSIPCTNDSDAFRWNHTYDREPFRLGGNTGTTVCGDLDRDGHLDLLNTEIVHWDVGSSSDPTELLVNNGEPDVRFTRPGNAATGLVRAGGSGDFGDMTAALFDFDNDGRLDVYLGSADYPGTRGWLFRQRPDGTFVPVPPAEGIDHLSSHGLAVADFDRDGDLDLVVGHSRNRCVDQCYPQANARFFRNELGHQGNWLQLSLVGGEGTNRAAIGARVTVKTDEGSQLQEVGGGHGHYGIQHDLVQHFGLGAACEAEVTVRWPNADGHTESFKLPAGYRYRLVEGKRPEVVELP